MRRIGIVVQRFGAEVLGGAENLAREVAVRLAERGFLVSVFTTCSLDYQTWKNHYRCGEFYYRGVRILRFPVDEERKIEEFNQFSERFFQLPPAERDEMNWIIRQGPFSPQLINALSKDRDQDLFLFFTYLYYPTVCAVDYLRKPFFFFPTAHDELPLYLQIMKKPFQKAAKIFFLTSAEMELVRRVFNPFGELVLLRTGLNFPQQVDPFSVRSRFFLLAPYVLYAGRIENGKGLDEAINFFRLIRRKHYIDFVLIGRKQMELPVEDGVRYLGFVSEEEKFALFKAALFSLQPSFYESLSFSTLESFSQQVPVLANGRCPALTEHVNLSGGGILYNNLEEFRTGFYKLTFNPGLRRKMGMAGFDYLCRYYSWDGVMETLKKKIEEVLT